MSWRSRFLQAIEELWISLFAWIPTPIGMAIRLIAWRFFFRSCGNVRFGTALTFAELRAISLGSGCRIGRGSFLTATNGSLELARDVAIAPLVNIGADHGSIRIGNKVAIGPGTVIRAANHRFCDPDQAIMSQGHMAGVVDIGDDVWIGANCVITPDVRIGRGAVIGAGAVVTRDIPPLAIAAGVPARVIGQRGAREMCRSDGN